MGNIIIPKRTIAVNQPQVGNRVDYGNSLSRGLKAYWPFNEGRGFILQDIATGLHNGAIQNVTVDNWSGNSGRLNGRSLLFDNSNDVVNCGLADDILVAGKPLSISLWVYPITIGSMILIDKGDPASTAITLRLQLNVTNIIQFAVFGSTSLLHSTSNNVMVLNKWQNIILTWDGTTTAANAHIYINNVEPTYQTTQNGITLTDNSGQPITLGNRTDLLRTLNGYLSNVKVWNRELRRQEVRDDFSNPWGLIVSPKRRVYFTPDYNSPQGPRSGTGANDASTGDVAWTNPTNVAASDNAYATSSITTLQTTQILTSTNFGFNVPSGNIVTGIVVEIEHSDNVISSIKDLSVRLIKGGTISGNDKASATNWPTSDAYASYGSSSDLWGLTLTSSDVNASNFGVSLRAQTDAIAIASVDHIRISVYHSAPVVATATPTKIPINIVAKTAVTINYLNNSVIVTKSSLRIIAKAASVSSGSANSFPVILHRRYKTVTESNFIQIDWENPLTNRLGAYWPMNEAGGLTLRDLIKKRICSLTNISVDNWTSSISTKLNTKMPLFDGVDDYGNCGTNDDILLSSRPCSISAWIHPITLGGSNAGRIIAKQSGAGAGTVGISFGLNSTSALFFNIRGTLLTENRSAAGSIVLNKTQHVCATWDGGILGAGIKLYINGIETPSYQSTLNGSGIFDNSGNQITIANVLDLSRSFNGKIGNLKSWNRILSPTEVKYDYSNPWGMITSNMRKVYLSSVMLLPGSPGINATAFPATNTMRANLFNALAETNYFSGIINIRTNLKSKLWIN